MTLSNFIATRAIHFLDKRTANWEHLSVLAKVMVIWTRMKSTTYSVKHATLKRRCQKKHDASERIVKSAVHLHDIRTKRNRPQSLMALEWPMGPLKYLNVAFDQQQTTLNVLAMLPRTVQNAL